jgi:hypothetical protein
MARGMNRQYVTDVLDNVHCLKLWRHTQSPPAGSKWIRQPLKCCEFHSLRQWTLWNMSHHHQNSIKRRTAAGVQEKCCVWWAEGFNKRRTNTVLYNKLLCFIIYKYWFLAPGNLQGQERFLIFKKLGWGFPGLEGITSEYYNVVGPTLLWENLATANTKKVKMQNTETEISISNMNRAVKCYKWCSNRFWLLGKGHQWSSPAVQYCSPKCSANTLICGNVSQVQFKQKSEHLYLLPPSI